jgi:hypothetical protein
MKLTKTLYVLPLIFVLFIVWMNLTPGSFRYAPLDGCSCGASYSTVPVDPFCEVRRKDMCDGPMFIDDFLVTLSNLDLYK